MSAAKPPARRSVPRVRNEQYVVAVGSWDLQWLFSIGDPKRELAPYSEHSTLIFRGALHRPTPFGYGMAKVELGGWAELPDPGPNRSLGYLDAHHGTLRAYLVVPVDRLAMLTAAAPRIRLIALGGDVLFRRRGLVRSLHVDTTFNPEDW